MKLRRRAFLRAVVAVPAAAVVAKAVPSNPVQAGSIIDEEAWAARFFDNGLRVDPELTAISVSFNVPFTWVEEDV